MSYEDIKVRVLKEVIADLGPFITKDVSEDPRMKQAHLELVDHSHYHAFVGSALSFHHVKLEIDEIQKGTKRGSRWKKTKAPSGR
jgi:hypothetical protein